MYLETLNYTLDLEVSSKYNLYYYQDNYGNRTIIALRYFEKDVYITFYEICNFNTGESYFSPVMVDKKTLQAILKERKRLYIRFNGSLLSNKKKKKG